MTGLGISPGEPPSQGVGGSPPLTLGRRAQSTPRTGRCMSALGVSAAACLSTTSGTGAHDRPGRVAPLEPSACGRSSRRARRPLARRTRPGHRPTAHTMGTRHRRPALASVHRHRQQRGSTPGLTAPPGQPGSTAGPVIKVVYGLVYGLVHRVVCGSRPSVVWPGGVSAVAGPNRTGRSRTGRQARRSSWWTTGDLGREPVYQELRHFVQPRTSNQTRLQLG